MNKFPLDDDAFNALHSFSKTPLRDKGKYRFDGVTMARDNKTAPKFNYRAPSKRSAKHDKVALRYARSHNIKPALASEAGYYAAGLKDRFNGRRSLGIES